MLHEFLIANRSELLHRCRKKVAARRAPQATPPELEHCVPLFLDQLTEMLAHPATAAESRMEDGATRHGEELRRHSYTLEQVVHDYGDLCQSITELAHEQDAPVTALEFGALSSRLDNAIASAVTAFARQRGSNQPLEVLAKGMRDALDATITAITTIKAGSAGFGGARTAELDRSLIDMRAVIDRTLAECGPAR